eukprot:m.37199 g.37199  ORF g.37199 m.37199 type:complete len:218 (+) comp5497_c0_seq1:338-991(+)
MAGAGVTTESHGPTHDEVVGNMQAYAGADGGPAKHGVHVHPQHSDDDAAVAGHFLECVRGVFQSSDDERGYAEFCRVVHTGQLHKLEALLGPYPKLLSAAVELSPAAWGCVREGTHADNAMGYIRRVAEQCPQEIYSEFLSAIRGAVTGVPVEDVYMRIAQLFSMIPHTKQRLELLHEFFVCHMPQEARDNVIAFRREQFPELDLLAAAAVQQAPSR